MASGAKKKEQKRQADELLAIKRQAKQRKEAAKKKMAKKKAKKQSLVSDDEDIAKLVAKRPKGVMVTADEIRETAARMNGEQTSATAAASPSSSKKGAAKKGRASATPAAPAAAATATDSTTIEPNHSYDVHVKRKEIIIIVALPRVPLAAINLDATSKTRFVVDTCKKANSFIKPYRLDMAYPGGIIVDHDKADYTLENGQLRCVFPITTLPDGVAGEIEKRLQSERDGRAKRFIVSQDGHVTTRTRKVKWIKEDTSSKHQKKSSEGTSSDAQLNALANSIEKEQNIRTKRARDDASGSTSTAAKEEPQLKRGRKESNGNGGHDAAVQNENAKLLAIAADAGKAARTTTKQKQQSDKVRYEKKEMHVTANKQARAARSENKKESFTKMLDTKRRQLQLIAQAMAPKPKSNNPNAKNVKFA